MFFKFLVALAFLRNFLFNAMGVNHFFVVSASTCTPGAGEGSRQPSRARKWLSPTTCEGSSSSDAQRGGRTSGGFIYAPYSHQPGRKIETKIKVQHVCTHDPL